MPIQRKVFMSHEITVREDGTAETFQVKVPAWHKLGTVVQEAPTSAEAIKLAHLDWEVDKIDLFGYFNDKLEIVEGKVGIQRVDNGKILGVVGSNYHPVQNAEAFSFLDSIVKTGDLKYETAGSLRGGAGIWFLARMPEQSDIIGDLTDNFILLKTGHDGLTSMEVMLTKVRVVCQNTLNMALRDNVNRIRVKHCLNMPEKIDKARELLLGIRAESDNLDNVLRNLGVVGVVNEKVTEFLDKMFPLPTVADQPATKTKNIRDQIMTNFDFDNETQTVATKGSAYGLLNAVTKYVDHQRGEKNELKAATSAMFGSGSDIKDKALETLRTMYSI